MVASVSLGVLVFMLAVTVDVFFVMWTIHSNAGRAVKAAVAAVFIQVFGVLGTLIIVKEPWLLVLNAAGHGLGTYLAVMYDRSQRNEAVNRRLA